VKVTERTPSLKEHISKLGILLSLQGMSDMFMSLLCHGYKLLYIILDVLFHFCMTVILENSSSLQKASLVS